MNGAQRRQLRAQASAIPVTVRVGKAGPNGAVLEEISACFKRESLVKVKLLDSARESADRQALAESLATGTGADLVEVRGNTVVLYRARRQEKTPEPKPRIGAREAVRRERRRNP
ncbi:MAG TPA: YhbY family RNA-binding protein [Burkholderiales bacterium]|nr:YhbY family RNA-binding protein [Burkholderiales bacterium]